jgi:hypothetical protein
MLRTMAEAGSISPADLKMLLITDDVKEAMAHIERNAIEAFGLRRRAPKPSTVLGESGALAGGNAG